MTERAGADRRIYNCVPSRNTDRDRTWEAALGDAGVPRISSANLPDEVDLRRPEWTVRDQGATGACVGFATADGVLRWHLHRRGLLPSLAAQPSPRFIWMADKETDDSTEFPTTFIEKVGAQTKNALAIARRFGCVLEEDLPMHGGMWTGAQDEFYARAARHRIKSYHSLRTELKVWRKWLATNGPILARLAVDVHWDAAPASGLLDDYSEEAEERGHAVCVVGYRADGRFIVRNSWGADWGDGGFGYPSEAYVRRAFKEAYGAVL